MRIQNYTLSFLLLLFLREIARADDTKLGGHVKYQFTNSHYSEGDLNELLGPSDALGHSIDTRINFETSNEPLTFVAQGELLGIAGDNVETARQILESGASVFKYPLLPNDDRRLFRLTENTTSDSDSETVARFDRLNLTYTSESYVARFGRQAISWGGGLAFQVLDPFNPFSPTEIDKDYKVGDDMFFQQALFSNGDDLQALVIPRRDIASGDLENSESSYALKFHGTAGESGLSYDVLAARHFNDNLFGAGLSRNIFDAVWRLDAMLTDLDNGEQVVSLVANIDRSWNIMDYNVYTFLEYFRNGFGSGSDNYLDPQPELSERVERGELFNLGTDYLTGGLQIELNPRLNLYLSEIKSLHDPSGVFQFRIVQDLFQDLLLTIGMNVPHGPRDTEYGGMRLGPEERFLAGGIQAYARLSFYW